MLAAQGFWQTTWPIISAPLFFVLGYLGTFLTSSKIEEHKHDRDSGRRTHEWQRENLIALQEAVVEHASLTTVIVVAYYDAVNGPEWAGKGETRPSPNEVTSDDRLVELRRLGSRFSMFAARCLDKITRDLCDQYAEEIRNLGLSGSRTACMNHDVAALNILQKINDRIGELLRTAYA